jgi:hypothetical protein
MGHNLIETGWRDLNVIGHHLPNRNLAITVAS